MPDSRRPLLVRLRSRATQTTVTTARLLTEAADEIERLTRERDELIARRGSYRRLVSNLCRSSESGGENIESR